MPDSYRQSQELLQKRYLDNLEGGIEGDFQLRVEKALEADFADGVVAQVQVAYLYEGIDFVIVAAAAIGLSPDEVITTMRRSMSAYEAACAVRDATDVQDGHVLPSGGDSVQAD